MENCIIVYKSKNESRRIQKILFNKGITWDTGRNIIHFENPFVIINNNLYQTGMSLHDTKLHHKYSTYRYFYNFTGNDFLKNFN